jgi:hypothetical protein
MIFWVMFFLLFFIFLLFLIDYFMIKKWTKSVEKSIDDIFDKISKTTIVVVILSIFGFNDENKNDNNDLGV